MLDGLRSHHFGIVVPIQFLNIYEELYKMSRNSIFSILLLLISVNVLAQNDGKKIPFKLVNNHIYIHGFLNDTLPVSILLDCGAGTIVSQEQTKKGWCCFQKIITAQ